MSLTIGAGTAIAGAAALAGNALAIGGQGAMNSHVARLQNRFNIDMWNRTNEYNSPQAQMKRFEEAGLNPNLIYGQGTAGNASSPPQQVAPEPVRIDKAAQELAKAFNIENLLSADADRRMKEAVATQEAVKAQNMWDERKARADFSSIYYFNMNTGRFEPYTAYNTTVETPASRSYRQIKALTGAYPNSVGVRSNVLADMYSKGLLSARLGYLNKQSQFLTPQIQMRNFDASHYKDTYFLDRAKGMNIGGYINAAYHYIKPYLSNF